MHAWGLSGQGRAFWKESDPGLSTCTRGRFTMGTGLDWAGIRTEHCSATKVAGLACNKLPSGRPWRVSGREGIRLPSWQHFPMADAPADQGGNACAATDTGRVIHWPRQPRLVDILAGLTNTMQIRWKWGQRGDGNDAGQAAKSAGDGSVVFIEGYRRAGRVSASRHSRHG